MALAFVSKNEALGTTITMPTHDVNQGLIMFAYRNGSTTAPTVPTGWVSIGTNTGTTSAAVAAIRKADTNAETSGTWTNATGLIAYVVSGQYQSGDFAVRHAGASGTGTTVNYSGITTMREAGVSMGLRFSATTTTDSALETAPAGFTNRANLSSTGIEMAAFDTNGPAASVSFAGVSVGGTSANWITQTIEILADHAGTGVEAKTNVQTGPSSVSSLASIDPGFQPKALITWNGLQTAVGAVADAQFNWGAASSYLTERAAGYNSDDTVATSDGSRYFSQQSVIANRTSGTATQNIEANVGSLDVTGYTLGWTTLATTSPIYNYLAIGGQEITQVKSGDFAVATSGATQAVTGIGFKPDIVFLFATIQTAAGTSNNNNQYTLGVMTPYAQWAVGQRMQNGVATMNTTKTFVTNRAITLLATATNTEFHGMSFVSMDTDGFTMNIDTQGGTAFLTGYLAIKGGRWKVGTETQKTSTGTKSTTGMGFKPKGVMFAGAGDTTTGISDHARLFFGATTGTSNNTAVWTGDADNTADAVANTIMSSSKAIVMATEGTSATPTTNADAALSSFDGDGFTLNWTTADATARLFGYVAFGGYQISTNQEVLLPNGAPDVNTGWPDNGDNAYTKVNTDDGDTSYIYTPTLNSKVTYPTQDSAVNAGTIGSVTVKYKIKALDPASSLSRAVIRVGGTDYTGQTDDTVTNNTSYVEFSKTWYTSPNTGSAWTWSEVNSMQIGVEKMNTAGERVTYIQAVVNYTPGGAPTNTGAFFSLF